MCPFLIKSSIIKRLKVLNAGLFKCVLGIRSKLTKYLQWEVGIRPVRTMRAFKKGL